MIYPGMFDGPDKYQMACLMETTKALSVREMIKCHTEFSGIEIDIGLNREAHKPFQSELVSEGKVLVTFYVPCRCINMVDFFREMGKTLNQESETIRGERDQ